ncbi:tyrosine-type recombinase/integrase [Ochrobactrum sp. Marseille-Q0166]|uniref:tyrosine-type recombinase/integrase n=1 Tax=Ochrobactrum sp. Marseille-Q0166 TaxID=2761105 RepID=UPI0016555AA6|nr:tyrosine-type recombinase/integrase [Ochrobactrum sp. Marseille-Q0166]MBC8718768.1 tyrosine-type recombinase/integrase [Ochrobactrum sp. Marseille-Q0166]
MNAQSCDKGGMPRKLPLYVHKQLTRHKKWVFYFRMGKGKRIRLPSPNDPSFKAAYHAALTGQPIEVKTVHSGTLQWLWEKYTNESAKWAGYSDATRKQQRLIMEKVLAVNANKALTSFTQDVMQEAVDRRHETPAMAANFLKVMRGMFGWAKKMRLVLVDPTLDIDLPEYKTSGFPAWTVEDVIAYRGKHTIGSPQRLAMELMLLAGIRRSDVVRVGIQHITGRILTMDTAKTGARISVELSDELLALIDGTSRKGLHLIESTQGKPFTKESFGNWFRDACTEAGVTKSAHGLRKLSATLAAEGGAATHQLLAQYGWTNIATAEIYTKGVDRKRLGIEASRIVADQIGNMQPLTSTTGEGIKSKKATKSTAKK